MKLHRTSLTLRCMLYAIDYVPALSPFIAITTLYFPIFTFGASLESIQETSLAVSAVFCYVSRRINGIYVHETLRKVERISFVSQLKCIFTQPWSVMFPFFFLLGSAYYVVLPRKSVTSDFLRCLLTHFKILWISFLTK